MNLNCSGVFIFLNISGLLVLCNFFIIEISSVCFIGLLILVIKIWFIFILLKFSIVSYLIWGLFGKWKIFYVKFVF